MFVQCYYFQAGNENLWILFKTTHMPISEVHADVHWVINVFVC